MCCNLLILPISSCRVEYLHGLILMLVLKISTVMFVSKIVEKIEDNLEVRHTFFNTFADERTLDNI